MFVLTNPGHSAVTPRPRLTYSCAQRLTESDQAELACLIRRELGDGDEAENAANIQDVGLVRGEQRWESFVVSWTGASKLIARRRCQCAAVISSVLPR